MNIRIKKIIFALSIVLVAFSCKDSGHYQSVNSQKISKSSDDTHKVIAKEFENAGMYTYVKVSENNDEFWVAIPETEVEIGKEYFYKGGMKMVNFESKELNKTFETVWFLDALYKEDPKNIPGHSKKQAIKEIVEFIQQPDNGTSIEKLLSDPEPFSKKEIIIKGKVVKVNRNILDRNWVHLKDGTAFNDKTEITISTNDIVKTGDIITFKGRVTLNKDFGYGYIYPVLIEDGQVLK